LIEFSRIKRVMNTDPFRLDSLQFFFIQDFMPIYDHNAQLTNHIKLSIFKSFVKIYICCNNTN
jgi:hypothetical protein